MNKMMTAAMSALLVLCLSACESCKEELPEPPPPTNRIDYLSTDDTQGQEKLYIYGKFPDTKGTVTLDNTPLKVSTWSPNLIICENLGAASLSGDVRVNSENTTGKRRLYHWLIHFKSERPHGGAPSNATEMAECLIALRGDIIPAPAHVFTESLIELLDLGPITYTASGVANSMYGGCNKVRSEWGSTNVEIDFSQTREDAPTQSHFFGWKKIRPDGFDLFIDFQAWEVIPMTLTHTSCNGSTSTSEKMWNSQVLMMDGYDPIPLRFDDKGHILPGSIEEKVYNSTQLIWDFEQGEAYATTAKISWTATRYPLD